MNRFVFGACVMASVAWIAGTLVIHPKDWDDVPRDPSTEKPSPGASDEAGEGKNPTAEASMFYVAYFKDGGKNTEGKSALVSPEAAR